MPGSPSGPRTYVRRFVSRNALDRARGSHAGRDSAMRNGISVTQARPSRRSSSSSAGTSGRTAAAGSAQWTNRRSRQRCRITARGAPRSGLVAPRGLPVGSPLEIPIAPIAILENLLRGPQRCRGRLLHAERVADLVDDVLVRCGDAAADRFLARALRARPIRVQVAGARPGAGLVMLGDVAQEPHRVATILDAVPVASGRGGSLAPPRLVVGRLASPRAAPGCLRAFGPGSCRLAALACA